MQHPTYSPSEIKALLCKLDYEGLMLLGELLSEEKECYAAFDYKNLRSTWSYFLNLEIERMDR